MYKKLLAAKRPLRELQGPGDVTPRVAVPASPILTSEAATRAPTRCKQPGPKKPRRRPPKAIENVDPEQVPSGAPGTSSGGTRQAKNKFAITVRCGSVLSESIRTEFLSSCPESIAYLISLESGKSNGHSEKHLHCYFHFVNKFKYVDLVKYFTDKFPDYTIHVEAIKNLRNYIGYITKEDMFFISNNVSESYFSFKYKCFKILPSLSFFDVSHPFIVEHRNCYKFLERMYNQFKNPDFCAQYSYVWPCILFSNNWFLELYNWFVNYCSSSYYYKKPHLYLYGTSNCGKTYAVNYITKCLFNRIYFPSSPPHFFDRLTEDYKVVIWDEFKFISEFRELYLLFLSGSMFGITRKYCDDRLFCNKIPVIFISNYPPPDDEAFRNRLLIVECDDFLQVLEDIPITEVCITGGVITEDIDGVS